MEDEMEFDPSAPEVEPVASASETPYVPPPEAGRVVKTEANDAASQALLGRLLAMAQRYRKEGRYQQATELFWKLAEEHPATSQAEAAKLELQELADDHGRAGAPRMARSMYERLLELEG